MPNLTSDYTTNNTTFIKGSSLVNKQLPCELSWTFLHYLTIPMLYHPRNINLWTNMNATETSRPYLSISACDMIYFTTTRCLLNWPHFPALKVNDIRK